MAKLTYFPDRGDLVHLNWSPSAGHVEAGEHYAIVLSTASFARKTGYALACPITSHVHGWVFEVRVPAGLLPRKRGETVDRDSVILVDQVRSVDFRYRGMTLIRKAPDEILDAVLAIVRGIIDSDDVVDELEDG